MILLGIDLEVDHVDLKRTDGVIYTDETNVTEIGLVVWDTDRNVSLECISLLIKEPRFEKIDKELEELCGIKTKEVLNYGRPPKVAISMLNSMIKNYNIEVIVAHNGLSFDYPMVSAFLKRHGGDSTLFDNLLKVDTLKDIEYPKYVQSKTLIYLAGYYGFLAGGHRAIFDVISMLNVMSKFNIENIIESAKKPEVEIIANVSYNNRQLAKEAGFRWNPELRKWYKVQRADETLEESIDLLGFECEVSLKKYPQIN